MELISLYFAKYKNIGLEDKIIKETICDILKKVCNIEIDLKKIKIENNEIKIKILGPAKSQILIKKTKINNLFKEKIDALGIKKNRIIS